MNSLFTTIVLVAVGTLVASRALEHAELNPTREASAAESRCPINCQGDFPVNASKTYAARSKLFETTGIVRG